MSAATTLPSNPDTLWKILPRSATQLERDILTATSSDDLRDLFGLISKVKREMEPESWLPILLTEYGFAEIAKHHKNWRLLLAASKDLRGKWGTPYAVEKMARLLRYMGAEIWEEGESSNHFSEFQLDLGGYEHDLTRLARLRKMVNVIKPVRGRFRRIFNEFWDERQHVWDDSDWGSFWDNESGVDILPMGFYGDHRGDDIFLVSLGLDLGQIVSYPLPYVIDDTGIAALPFPLVEKDFSRLFVDEFFPRFDTEGWDGSFMVDSESSVGKIAEGFLLTQTGGYLIEDLGTPSIFQTVDVPILDEDGFDGGFEFGGFVSLASLATAAEFEITSNELLEVVEGGHLFGVSDVMVLDTEFPDGEEIVTGGCEISEGEPLPVSVLAVGGGYLVTEDGRPISL